MEFKWNIQLSITFKANCKSFVIESLDELARNKPVTYLQVGMIQKINTTT